MNEEKGDEGPGEDVDHDLEPGEVDWVRYGLLRHRLEEVRGDGTLDEVRAELLAEAKKACGTRIDVLASFVFDLNQE